MRNIGEIKFGVGTKIEYCQMSVFCYAFPMTTNDLINLIRENHMNADCLAQIASAVECMQEELELDGREQERHDDGEPSDEGADAEWLASAGWGTDEDYE